MNEHPSDGTRLGLANKVLVVQLGTRLRNAA